MEKVVLIYTGRIESAICVHWLRKVRKLRVVTVSANLGQPLYLEPVGEHALELGAEAAHITDLRPVFAREYILPTLRAHAYYGPVYGLCGALALPLVVSELVRVASEEGCEYIANDSSSFEGDDVIRLRLMLRELGANLKVLCPLAEVGLRAEGQKSNYARQHGLKARTAPSRYFSLEQNLWGARIELAEEFDHRREAPAETYVVTEPPHRLLDRPTEVEIEFKQGSPVALDGERMPLVRLIETLNALGAKQGVGRIEVYEELLAGGKRRRIYEAPAAAILYRAIDALHQILWSRELIELRDYLGQVYGRLVHEGRWFGMARRSLDAFFNRCCSILEGKVRLRVFRHRVDVLSREAAFL
jgi:argininosuccinate synthase